MHVFDPQPILRKPPLDGFSFLLNYNCGAAIQKRSFPRHKNGSIVHGLIAYT